MNTVARRALILAVLAGTTTTCAKLSSADEWGCTVVLCLANPAGYAAISECVEPIRQMFTTIRNGGSPICDGGGVRLHIGRGKKQSQRYIQYTNAAGAVVTEYY